MRILSLVALLALAGCASEPPATTEPPTSTTGPSGTAPVEDDYGALAEARSKWEALGADSYHFEFENDCGECLPVQSEPREVVVWGAERFDPLETSPSVDEMFRRIEAALDEGLTVDVVYDADLGYPVEVEIDMESRPVDGGSRWMVRDLSLGLPGAEVGLTDVALAEELWLSQRPFAYEYTLSVWCDCPLGGSVLTRVEGDRVVSYDVLYDRSSGGSITPIAIDDMFSDLEDLLSSIEGVVEDGIRFSGSARFHPELGYPTWIGLDIDVLSNDPILADIPERLIVTMSHLREVETVRSESLDVELAKLEKAEALWAVAGESSYVYQLTYHALATAEYTGPFDVVVENDEVVSVTRQGEPVAAGITAGYTVERVYELIRLALESETEVSVLYNDVVGYPVLVQIDLEALAVDGGLAFSISDFDFGG